MSDFVKLDNNEFHTNGVIDFHAHIFEYTGHPGFNLNPDYCGIRRKISTVVDQGGPGAMNLEAFKKHIVDTSETHVQCFVSPYLIGGNARGEIKDMFGPRGMNADKTIQAVRIYDPNYNFVRGVKAHCGPSGYDEWGIEPLRVAREIAQELKIPLYVHLGSMWNFQDTDVPASKIVDQVLEILRPGDVVAHPYRADNGIVSTDGVIHPAVEIMKQKGILLDVGRGTKISFRNIRIMLENGYGPDIISSDLHGFGRPEEHGLLRVMDEMLHLGMPAESIVRAVTTTPGKYLKNCPNVQTKLCIVEGKKSYSDTMGETIVTDKVFKIESI